MNDTHQPSGGQDTAARFDGARMAVLANRMESIVRKMQNTLQRSARSGVISVARDFSCCILTPDCRLLATGESIPIHVMAGPDVMCRTMMDYHPDFRRGDAYLNNSPYHGNTHAADHGIIVPVIDDDGVHRFTILAKAHQADCGNSIPTTYMDTAEDVYHEGALIFPAVLVQRDNKDIDDIIRVCRMRIRVPEQWWGDYLATLGAARIGEQELLALGAEIGWDDLARFVESWFDYSEQRMVQTVQRLPKGTVRAANTYDPIDVAPDGIPIEVSVDVDPDAARIVVDLRDNPDCLPCGLNLSEACSRTAAMIGLFNSIDHTVPKNAGSFRRLDVLLREGCVVGIPRHPHSCSVATTNLSDHVICAVQRAMSELSDGVGMAEVGYGFTPSGAVVSGNDPRFDGRPFVNEIQLGDTVGAAGPDADGWLTYCHAGNAGMMFYDSIEVDELHHPMRVQVRRVLADSEGPGRWRAAPAQYTEYGPVGTAMRVIYASDGMVHASLGAAGGGPGTTAGQWRRTVDGELEPLPASGDITLRDGETIVCQSSSGGGYGPPWRREAERVAVDVAEGFVSQARARDVYGVEMNEAGHVLETQTAARRRLMESTTLANNEEEDSP